MATAIMMMMALMTVLVVSVATGEQKRQTLILNHPPKGAVERYSMPPVVEHLQSDTEACCYNSTWLVVQSISSKHFFMYE
jgi:hypothetical protein